MDPLLASSSESPTLVLIVNGDPEDAELAEELLKEAPGSRVETVRTRNYEDGVAQLASGGFDVCLLDYRLGPRSGLDFLKDPRVVATGVPVLLLTGGGDPEVDAMALAAGAVDFLPKEGLTSERLDRAMRYAVEGRRRRDSEALARALLGSVGEVVSIVDPRSGVVKYVSPSIRRVLGYPPEEKVGRSALEEVHPEDRPRLEENLDRMIRDPGSRFQAVYRIRDSAGKWRVMESVAENHSLTPGVEGILVSARDVTERAERDERLRFQASLLDAVGQAIIAVDLGNRVIYWNPGAERLFGWSPSEALGRDVSELTTPDPIRLEAHLWGEDLAQGAYMAAEYTGRRKDGSTFPAVASVSPFQDPEGGLQGYITAVSDVSRPKAAEQALAERVKEFRTLTRAGEVLNRQDLGLEARLQELVDLIPDGWRRPEFTAARLRVRGLELKSPGHREDLRFRMAEALETDGRAGELEVVYLEDDWRPSQDGEASPFLPEEREVLRSLARLVSDAVRREGLQRLLTQAFASIQEAVLVVGTTGEKRGVAYMNPAAERMFGYAPEELVGGTTEKLHVDHDAFLRFAHEGDPHLRGRGVFHGDFPMRRKDGSVFQAEQTVGLLEPEKGLAGGVVSVVRDVSEKAALESQLRQIQKIESVGQLAGGIAHDFNNILTVIRAQVDLLLLDDPPEAMVQDLRMIQTSADRAATLTAQLLAFSREQILLPKVVDLGELVLELVRLLTRILGEQIQVDHLLSADLPKVRVDPHRLEQVLLNLALNARDAMPTGGTLTFTTSLEELSPEQAATQAGLNPGRWVVLTVSDTGTGMSDEVRSRAFDPFFSTKAKGKGTGLGLAMVYGTVKQSGGHIQLESRLGEGTVFRIRLPPHESDTVLEDRAGTDAPLENPPLPHNAPAGGTLLLVEDDPAVRRSLVRILERAGVSLLQAATAEEGIALLEDPDRQIHAVLTDLILPGMNGFDFMELIRRRWPELPIVAMSGYAEGIPHRQEGLPADVGFLQKPFAVEEVVAVVRRTLPPSPPWEEG